MSLRRSPLSQSHTGDAGHAVVVGCKSGIAPKPIPVMGKLVLGASAPRRIVRGHPSGCSIVVLDYQRPIDLSGLCMMLLGPGGEPQAEFRVLTIGQSFRESTNRHERPTLHGICTRQEQRIQIRERRPETRWQLNPRSLLIRSHPLDHVDAAGYDNRCRSIAELGCQSPQPILLHLVIGIEERDVPTRTCPEARVSRRAWALSTLRDELDAGVVPHARARLIRGPIVHNNHLVVGDALSLDAPETAVDRGRSIVCWHNDGKRRGRLAARSNQGHTTPNRADPARRPARCETLVTHNLRRFVIRRCAVRAAVVSMDPSSATITSNDGAFRCAASARSCSAIVPSQCCAGTITVATESPIESHLAIET